MQTHWTNKKYTIDKLFFARFEFWGHIQHQNNPRLSMPTSLSASRLGYIVGKLSEIVLYTTFQLDIAIDNNIHGCLVAATSYRYIISRTSVAYGLFLLVFCLHLVLVNVTNIIQGYFTGTCILIPWLNSCDPGPGQILRGAAPKTGIKGRDKWLHPTVSVGCNYLSMLLMPASGAALLNFKLLRTHRNAVDNFTKQSHQFKQV